MTVRTIAVAAETLAYVRAALAAGIATCPDPEALRLMTLAADKLDELAFPHRPVSEPSR